MLTLLINQLLQQAALALRLAPRLLWLLLGGSLLAMLNLGWRDELWPHTPGAESFFELCWLLCGVTLPWLLARTAQLAARHAQGWFWRLLWQLTAVGGYVGAFLCSIPGLFGLVYMVGRLLG